MFARIEYSNLEVNTFREVEIGSLLTFYHPKYLHIILQTPPADYDFWCPVFSEETR